MPETPEHLFPRLTPKRRLRVAFKSLAAALCAAVFFLPVAQQAHAAKKSAPVAKKAVASAKKSTAAETKRSARSAPAKSTKGKAVASRGKAESAKSARASRAERQASRSSARERKVVATLHRGKHGRIMTVAAHPSSMRAIEPPPPPRLSFGQMAGLGETEDPLDLKSNAVLVLDQDSQEVLFRKNDRAVLPIASLTKLMTGLLISEARLPMDELITITQDDVDTEKGSRSRLYVGATLSRGELLHLALMSSENRAAHALGRTYPGGLSTFVSVMNAKARMLGMHDTHYVEPTGLSFHNQSTARDLALLVNVASNDAMVRQYSTSPEHQVELGSRTLQFNTTNRLVRSPEWDIGLQKTGFISEAGQCLVMQARVAGRKLIMVFLDSSGKLSRIADAERVRRWVETTRMASPTAMRTASAQFAAN